MLLLLLLLPPGAAAYAAAAYADDNAADADAHETLEKKHGDIYDGDGFEGVERVLTQRVVRVGIQ